MTQTVGRWRTVIATLVLTTQLGSVMAPAAAYAQAARPPATGTSTPRRNTPQAGKDLYEQARFDEAITLLRGLVDGGQLAGTELQTAREFLARALVKKGLNDEGKAVFTDLLRSNGAWRPDPVLVPPDEVAVFEQALRAYQAEPSAAPSTPPAPTATSTPTSPPPAARVEPGAKKKSKALWYVLGGGVIVGLVAALAGGSGGKDSPTPDPVLAGFPTTP